jgi:hypothetical protein
MTTRASTRLATPSNTDFWLGADVRVYRRRSDPGRATGGNLSLEMQEESVPTVIEQTARLKLTDIESAGGVVATYEDEDISGTDADTRVDLESKDIKLTGFRRDAYKDMLREALERWRTTGRPQILCGFLLNRIGRSDVTVMLLRRLARQMRGNLLVWTTDQAGQFIDPSTRQGATLLFMAIDWAGGAESDTKRQFVTSIKDHIAEREADRSLGERLPGYRKYPCDAAGQRITNVYDVPDHYRLEVDPATRATPERAFALAAGGTRPRRIAQILQAEFGHHPVTRRRWTRQSVRWMLRNTLYIGQRRYKRTVNDTAGSKIRYAAPEAEHKISPYKAELRIVSDELFFAVQRRLEAWRGTRTTESRRLSVGRPLKANLFFHRTQLLRCGVCGAPLQVRRRGGVHKYYCVGLADQGFPPCQTHAGRDVDASIAEVVAGMFSSVDEYRVSLERELAHSRSGSRLGTLQAELHRLEGEAAEKKGVLFRALRDDALGAVAKRAFSDDYEAAVAAVEAKKQEVTRFGQTEGDRAKADMVALLKGVAAFRTVPFLEQKAIVAKLFAGVWIWPDAVTYFQMTGESVEQARVNALAQTGRMIGEARAWEPINYAELDAATRRLIAEGEIPQSAFAGVAQPVTLYHWLTRGRVPRLRTALAVYERAAEQYVDLARLREDLRAWVQAQLAEGRSFRQLEVDLDRIAVRHTLARVAEGKHVRRETTLALGARVLDLAAYQTPPADLYRPEHLAEITAFLLATPDEDEGAPNGGADVSAADERVTRGSRTASFGFGTWDLPTLIRRLIGARAA